MSNKDYIYYLYRDIVVEASVVLYVQKRQFNKNTYEYTRISNETYVLYILTKNYIIELKCI